MKRFIVFLVSLHFVIPGLSLASPSSHSIHIEWSFDQELVGRQNLAGYHLYKEGLKVCTTDFPDDTSMDCEFESEPGESNFTLTAFYTDGTESPHSPTYTFNVGPIPQTDNKGSHRFTFSWETNENTTDITGYRVYLNNTQLCESHNPQAQGLTCNANLLSEIMEFTLTTLYSNNTESDPSNLLRFDPTEYPQFFNTKLLSFSWEYPVVANLSGFKIYQNGKQICETSNPSDRQISCNANIGTSEVNFAISAVDKNQNETTLSNILTYVPFNSSNPPPNNDVLGAQITTDNTSGSAPLTISFNGAESTGKIQSYAWSFGDGATGKTNTVSHQYTIPGTYEARLIVSDLAGQTSSKTISITVADGSSSQSPPKAVISSSAAVGQAPFNVSFNAGGSTTQDATISVYHWDFGDGSIATGKNVSHSFATAGIFNTTLTITNSHGLTDSVNTPIIVTMPAQQDNQPPQAIISAMPSNGSAPLTVTFDASGSRDRDGIIKKYTWQFGDGTSGEGTTATHTYTDMASFTATLTVTDDDGAHSTSNTTITVSPEEAPPEFNIELGEISVNSKWARVEITTPFNSPVVIAGPPSSADTDPCVVRLKNISPTGFDIKIDEWDYLDGSHGNETVSYIVMEKGHFTLPDGTQVEAGTFSGTTNFKNIRFTTSFNTNPVVISAVSSNNEKDTISGHMQNISRNGFEYSFREQENKSNIHTTEAVGFIAWEQSSGTIDTLVYEVKTTPNKVTHKQYDVGFQTNFTSQPLFLADMQSTNEKKSASAIRVHNPTAQSIHISIEEEQSKDDEITHTTEVVGYLAIGTTEEETVIQNGVNKRFTFTWDYDTEGQDIAGFRFYLNNTQICETNIPTDRSISCIVPLLPDVMDFTMTAVDSNGTETVPSSLLRINPMQFPQLSPKRQAKFTWEYDKTDNNNILGFRILMNNNTICETNDSTARQLSCTINAPTEKTIFTIQAMNVDSTTTEPSNVITYTP